MKDESGLYNIQNADNVNNISTEIIR